MSKTNSEKRRMNKIETLLTLARLLTCLLCTQMEINYVFRFSNLPFVSERTITIPKHFMKALQRDCENMMIGNKMDPGSFEFFLFKDFLKKKT